MRDIERANSDIKNMQYEIKRVPKMKEVELNGKLNNLRTIVNELEENLNEKKRKFKYEIRLDNELVQLKKIQELDPANVDLEAMEEIGIQLPKEDSIAVEKFKESLKTSLTKHIKIPQISGAHDGPIIPSGKNENEIDLERKQNQPMAIDLTLQTLDNPCRRLFDNIWVFWQRYIKDRFTCPLMLIFVASVVFVIICALMSYKEQEAATTVKKLL
ncbi:UNKNOWN [Stylonychia lemnae]|uniref:Uncharacterized protein n=1 Tax=Stylonychia lemnae TaxID=5949 RepID=A0A078B6K7_STYLE|nr:UNKNOWN [Stylonychia lemnae]|eukprot:CDW90009.1 UNKNOWN [Stylonychia lemnae]